MTEGFLQPFIVFDLGQILWQNVADSKRNISFNKNPILLSGSLDFGLFTGTLEMVIYTK